VVPLPTIQPLRLSQLTDSISETLRNAFANRTFWVIADVTNHSFRQDKNYHHFDLVEKDSHSSAIIAKVQAKAWGKGSLSISNFQSLTGQRFTNNISVLVSVSVDFHNLYGLQLNVQEIDINFTLGALEQQRLATLAQLVLENPSFIRKVGDQFITRNKELLLNRVIQKIAVVSSSTSAGWQDFRHTLENNPFGYTYFVDDYFTPVQGENNAQPFVSKLIEIFTSHKPYDAIVIIRGGGAQTDFLIFDNYTLGKAVAKFPIPVITGIGHQKNETIADLMAHTATKTPTKAAEYIINHNHSFEEAIRQFQKTILIKAQQKCSFQFQYLALLNSTIVNKSRTILIDQKDRLAHIHHITINTSKTILFGRKRELLAVGSSLLTKPKVIVYNRLNDVKQLVSNITIFGSVYLKNKKGYIGHYITLFKALSVESTLKRGFALIKTHNKVTSNPDDLVVGKEFQVILSDQEITSTVKSKKNYHGNDLDL
jgi:exodeoxyribonuclease VII large subunit